MTPHFVMAGPDPAIQLFIEPPVPAHLKMDGVHTLSLWTKGGHDEWVEMSASEEAMTVGRP